MHMLTFRVPLAAYDVTRPDTFSDLDDIWMRELDMYSTVEDSVKMVVANKIDLVCHHEAAQLPNHQCAR